LMFNYVCNFVCVCVWVWPCVHLGGKKEKNRRVWSSINMSRHCYFAIFWMIYFHFSEQATH
jgi:hypothetical protein